MAVSNVRTCLWFNDNGLEAAEFYVSLLPGSEIEKVYRLSPDAAPLVIEFTLAGAPYMILNGGPKFPQSPAASISVQTKTQEETDALWSALTANGGEESMCAWLVDRFGVSWQIVPERLIELVYDRDEAAAARAREAMGRMRKIDIAALEAAHRGD